MMLSNGPVRTKILFLFTLPTLIFIALPSLRYANATTYYVDPDHPNSSDSNIGTAEPKPWRTLKKSCNTARAGDVVIVKAGVFIDSNPKDYSVFNPVHSGTRDNPIIFKSMPHNPAVIRAKGLPDRSNYAWAIYGRQYIIIEGFRIEGGAKIQDSSYCTLKNCDISVGRCPSNDLSLNWGLTLYGAKNCILENNYVHDIADSGNRGHNSAAVMVFSGSEDNVIQNNLSDAKGGIVYSSFGQKGGAIYRNTFRWNIARNASVGFLGMAATAQDAASEDNIYYQNVIINCYKAFSLNHMCYRFKIYNNTAYNCHNFLSAGRNTNRDTQLWNNIAWGNNRAFNWDGYEEASPFSVLIKYSNYNCFFKYSMIGFREKMPTLYYYTLPNWQSATGFDVNSLFTDPLFVDPDSYNFRLRADSPCRNAGIDRQDYNGNGNTSERINMGAYITGSQPIGPRLVPSKDVGLTQ